MIPYSQIIETISLLVASLLLTTSNAKIWKWFIPYLLLIVIGDWTGWIMMKSGTHNLWLYNIITLVQALFLGLFFLNIFPEKKAGKYFIFIGFACFLISYTGELLSHGIDAYVKYTQVVLSIWMMVLALGYYFYLLKEETYVSIYYHPPFWFVTGVFLFYFGSAVTNLFFDYFQYANVKNLHAMIFVVLNVILYSCWSYTFICKYRKKTLS